MIHQHALTKHHFRAPVTKKAQMYHSNKRTKDPIMMNPPSTLNDHLLDCSKMPLFPDAGHDSFIKLTRSCEIDRDRKDLCLSVGSTKTLPTYLNQRSGMRTEGGECASRSFQGVLPYGDSRNKPDTDELSNDRPTRHEGDSPYQNVKNSMKRRENKREIYNTSLPLEHECSRRIKEDVAVEHTQNSFRSASSSLMRRRESKEEDVPYSRSHEDAGYISAMLDYSQETKSSLQEREDKENVQAHENRSCFSSSSSLTHDHTQRSKDFSSLPKYEGVLSQPQQKVRMTSNIETISRKMNPQPYTNPYFRKKGGKTDIITPNRHLQHSSNLTKHFESGQTLGFNPLNSGLAHGNEMHFSIEKSPRTKPTAFLGDSLKDCTELWESSKLVPVATTDMLPPPPPLSPSQGRSTHHASVSDYEDTSTIPTNDTTDESINSKSYTSHPESITLLPQYLSSGKGRMIPINASASNHHISSHEGVLSRHKQYQLHPSISSSSKTSISDERYSDQYQDREYMRLQNDLKGDDNDHSNSQQNRNVHSQSMSPNNLSSRDSHNKIEYSSISSSPSWMLRKDKYETKHDSHDSGRSCPSKFENRMEKKQDESLLDGEYTRKLLSDMETKFKNEIKNLEEKFKRFDEEKVPSQSVDSRVSLESKDTVNDINRISIDKDVENRKNEKLRFNKKDLTSLSSIRCPVDLGISNSHNSEDDHVNIALQSSVCDTPIRGNLKSTTTKTFNYNNNSVPIAADIKMVASKTRMQIMGELDMALRMRKEAEEGNQRNFWDMQVDSLNAELTELRVGSLKSNAKELEKSNNSFESGDTRKEIETSKTPTLPPKSVRSLPAKNPNYQDKLALMNMKCEQNSDSHPRNKSQQRHSSTCSMPSRMITSSTKPQGILKKSSYQSRVPIRIETQIPVSRTLKLRAPAKLPGGYRFTTKIKGLKIQATVVSATDFSWFAKLLLKF